MKRCTWVVLMRRGVIPRAWSKSRVRLRDETHSYSLRDVETMLAVLPEPAATACAVAAFAGLRRSELRGLRWEDNDGDSIMVNRSVWEGFTNDPKTRKSK